MIMADGGQDFNLGHVVGSAGEKGDDGSTVWNTSTAPTYANSKYTFNISNLSGKTGLEIAVNDIIFYSTYYYIVSAVNSTTVDCSTRVSIKGSDASVTIQTSWGSTTSDSKVPSEKLTKDTLDTKIAKSSTTGLVKNDGTIMTSGTGSTNYSAGNHTHSGYISTSSTSGLVKNDGSIMTGGTGSTNWAIGNHTHSGYLSASKVTSWSSTVSDSNVPSEKLVKNTIDGLSIPTKTSDLTNDGADGTNVFVANNDSRLSDSRTPTSHTHGNLSNDGKLGTTSGKPVITTTGGAITTGSFGSTSGTFAEGNHTHSGYISTSSTTGLIKNDGTYVSTSDIADNLTTNDSTKVLSAKQGKALNDLIGQAIAYINQ